MDDFRIFFLAVSEECTKSLKIALETRVELRVPVAPCKVEGHASVITFPGIFIDSGAQQLR